MMTIQRWEMVTHTLKPFSRSISTRNSLAFLPFLSLSFSAHSTLCRSLNPSVARPSCSILALSKASGFLFAVLSGRGGGEGERAARPLRRVQSEIRIGSIRGWVDSLSLSLSSFRPPWCPCPFFSSSLSCSSSRRSRLLPIPPLGEDAGREGGDGGRSLPSP